MSLDLKSLCWRAGRPLDCQFDDDESENVEEAGDDDQGGGVEVEHVIPMINQAVGIANKCHKLGT